MGDWRLLLDENLDPKTVSYLAKEGVRAEHVNDVVGSSSPDETVVDRARRTESIVVTSDLRDYDVSDDRIDVLLLHDDTAQANEVAAAIRSMIDEYPSPAEFYGDVRDKWLLRFQRLPRGSRRNRRRVD